jgi:hypothetical protein
MGHINSLLVQFPISGCAFLSLQLVRGGKNSIALVRVMDTSAVITLQELGVPALAERTWPAVISSHMVIVVAPAA